MSRTDHDIQGFTPGGKAHRILSALDNAPQSIKDLYAVIGADTYRLKQAVRFIGKTLVSMDCADRLDGIFTIKPAGRDLLDALDAPIPTIRIFAKETT
jgi:hypothetical protein